VEPMHGRKNVWEGHTITLSPHYLEGVLNGMTGPRKLARILGIPGSGHKGNRSSEDIPTGGGRFYYKQKPRRRKNMAS